MNWSHAFGSFFGRVLLASLVLTGPTLSLSPGLASASRTSASENGQQSLSRSDAQKPSQADRDETQAGEAAEREARSPAGTSVTPETRQKMADMHEKMAACLRSDKPMSECRNQMMKECPQGAGGQCMMMRDAGGTLGECPQMHGGTSPHSGG